MDFEQVLTLRRSVRRFQNKEIPETLIDKMVRAGECSPIGKADFFALCYSRYYRPVDSIRAGTGGWENNRARKSDFRCLFGISDSVPRWCGGRLGEAQCRNHCGKHTPGSGQSGACFGLCIQLYPQPEKPERG